MPIETYTITAFYNERKKMKVRARSREEALEKIADRCDDRGIDTYCFRFEDD